MVILIIIGHLEISSHVFKRVAWFSFFHGAIQYFDSSLPDLHEHYLWFILPIFLQCLKPLKKEIGRTSKWFYGYCQSCSAKLFDSISSQILTEVGLCSKALSDADTIIFGTGLPAAVEVFDLSRKLIGEKGSR